MSLNKLTEREKIMLLNRNFLYCDICKTKEKDKIYYIIRKYGYSDTALLLCEDCKNIRNL
jgi:hypothetical protein